MYCSKCGEKLPDGAKFCSHCGTKVGITEAKTSEDDEKTVLMAGIPGKEDTPGDEEETVMMSGSRVESHPYKDRGPHPSSLKRKQDLKYTENIMRPDRKPENQRGKKKGGILFPILCVICIALAAGIAWQVWDIISVNRDLAAYETEHNKASDEEEHVNSSSTESMSTAAALVTDPMLQERIEA